MGSPLYADGGEGEDTRHHRTDLHVVDELTEHSATGPGECEQLGELKPKHTNYHISA